jgi:hypothetical protein
MRPMFPNFWDNGHVLGKEGFPLVMYIQALQQEHPGACNSKASIEKHYFQVSLQHLLESIANEIEEKSITD